MAQSDSDLEYLLSLVKHSALNEGKKVSQCALNAIDTVARNGKSKRISSNVNKAHVPNQKLVLKDCSN